MEKACKSKNQGSHVQLRIFYCPKNDTKKWWFNKNDYSIIFLQLSRVFSKILVHLPNNQTRKRSWLLKSFEGYILPVLICKIPFFLIIQTKFHEKLQSNLFLQANSTWIRWEIPHLYIIFYESEFGTAQI